LLSGWQNYGVVAGWDNLAMIDFDNSEAFELWKIYYDQQLARIYELNRSAVYCQVCPWRARVHSACMATEANQKRQGVDVKGARVRGWTREHPSEWRGVHGNG
jgi:hypothetical protein